MTTPSSSAAASGLGPRVQCTRGCSAQNSTAGVTTSTPTASPSHQVSQIEPKSLQRASSSSEIASTPAVAATAVLTIPASSARVKTSRARSPTRRPRAKRLTRYAPSSPSSVFPAAIATALGTAPVVVRFNRNAPTMIAGQTSYPASSRAASAIPVGGQTAVALGLTTANRSPRRPAPKDAGGGGASSG